MWSQDWKPIASVSSPELMFISPLLSNGGLETGDETGMLFLFCNSPGNPLLPSGYSVGAPDMWSVAGTRWKFQPSARIASLSPRESSAACGGLS